MLNIIPQNISMVQNRIIKIFCTTEHEKRLIKDHENVEELLVLLSCVGYLLFNTGGVIPNIWPVPAMGLCGFFPSLSIIRSEINLPPP